MYFKSNIHSVSINNLVCVNYMNDIHNNYIVLCFFSRSNARGIFVGTFYGKPSRVHLDSNGVYFEDRNHHLLLVR